MREDDSNWFSKWEDELPPPDELISLSQTLITPDLASAFDIRSSGVNNNNIIINNNSNNNNNNNNNSNNNDVPISFLHHHHQQYAQKQHHQSNSAPQQPPPQPNSSEFDSSSAELCGGGGGGATSGGGGGGGGPEEPARTLKRPRLVWTPQLHKRFVDAVAHLGIKNAVPKTIMQLMSVDGLTRENVASHLQKYRLYLKRMQSLNNGGGPGVGPASGGSGDAATDHLFATSPVPAHFLHQNGPGSAGGGGGGGRPNSDHFMPYMPVAALNHHQMAAAVVGHQQIQAQYQQQQHRQMGHFGSAQSVGGGGGGQFEHPFLSRQAQLGPSRNGLIQSNSGFVEDVESATANNGGRKVLTLFPDGDD